MTQKELIRQEIDTRRQHMVEELMGHEENCEYHRIKGMHDAYVDLLTFLDYSLPEEKPSEDLEEAAEKRARKIYPYEGGAKGLICENAIPIYKAGFIAGAEWQESQAPLPEDSVAFNNGVKEGKRLLMEEAVEGEVCESEYGLRDIVLQMEPFQKVMKGFKEGDKVKIIIVKQDAARRK